MEWNLKCTPPFGKNHPSVGSPESVYILELQHQQTWLVSLQFIPFCLLDMLLRSQPSLRICKFVFVCHPSHSCMHCRYTITSLQLSGLTHWKIAYILEGCGRRWVKILSFNRVYLSFDSILVHTLSYRKFRVWEGWWSGSRCSLGRMKYVCWRKQPTRKFKPFIPALSSACSLSARLAGSLELRLIYTAAGPF